MMIQKKEIMVGGEGVLPQIINYVLLTTTPFKVCVVLLRGGVIYLGVVLDTTSEGPHSLFVQIVTVFVQIVTKYT